MNIEENDTLLTTFKDYEFPYFRRIYYENGIIFQKLALKGDNLDGISKYYYETGELEQEIEYIYDVPNGFSRNYYKSG